jgi:protease I
MGKLSGKKVAILATNGFEQSELFEPLKAIKNEDAEVHIVSLEKGSIKGWSGDDWGESIDVDVTIDEIDGSEYDALVLPGGQINPDLLRVNDRAVAFVRKMVSDKKPVAAICHAPWLLIEAGAAKGRDLTSYHSIKTDVINAGANWLDEEVVVDDGIVTSRNPDDLPAFCAKVIEEIAEGKHEQRKVVNG